MDGHKTRRTAPSSGKWWGSYQGPHHTQGPRQERMHPFTPLCLKPSDTVRMRPGLCGQALLEPPRSAGVATVCLSREPFSRPRAIGACPVNTVPVQRPRPLPASPVWMPPAGRTHQFPWRVFCWLGLSRHCKAFTL